MADFGYVGYEMSGQKKTGIVSAPDRAAALAAIAAAGVHVLEIKEKANAGKREAPTVNTRVSASELALFTRRLADLSNAGLPLDRALELTAEQSDHPALKSIIEAAVEDVRAGIPVSEALKKYPKLFPTVFTMTLRAGEASGQFPSVAGRLADLQMIQVKRRSQTIGALIYPVLLACTSIVVVSFLMLYVVPSLSGVFMSLHAQLPPSTLLLMFISNFLVKNMLLIVGAVVAGVVLFRAWSSTVQGAIARDRWFLSLPLIGKIAAKSAISRYARVLSTLVYGGVPILEALRIAGVASGNRVLEAGSVQVQDEVRQGQRIAPAMKSTGAFSNLLVQMVAVGEETGDLPTMLNRVSDTLDFEVDSGTQKLIAFMEPVTVLVMGAFVGFVVLSVLMPIYQAPELIK